MIIFLKKVSVIYQAMLRRGSFNYLARYLTTENFSDSTKVEKKPFKPQKEYKIPTDVVGYFTVNNKKHILNQFHPKLLRKKHKPPVCYYLADIRAAKLIAEHLTNPPVKALTILEANPGLGLLTAYLEKSNAKQIYLFESNEDFAQKLHESFAAQSKRITVYNGDLVNLWKLVFQDRIDNGTRAYDLLAEIPIKEWTSSNPMRLYAGVGSLNFFRHLIISIVRQTDLFAHGRFEMFLIMPPPLYIHLTCSNQAGYLIYRANTMLFQIMFEHKFITKIPREFFIPWQYEQKNAKHTKLKKFNSIDSGFLYLVKILPRKNIYELCPLEDMQALWYFVRQNCISRKYRVIPNLEKWAPGCGPRLIINTKASEPIKRLYTKENIEELPKFSVPSMAISNEDLYPNMNIFTEFGDLSPSQILALFCQFRKWPEYKHSPFLASLEISQMKMELFDQDNVDGLDLAEEDYGVVSKKSQENDTIS